MGSQNDNNCNSIVQKLPIAHILLLQYTVFKDRPLVKIEITMGMLLTMSRAAADGTDVAAAVGEPVTKSQIEAMAKESSQDNHKKKKMALVPSY